MKNGGSKLTRANQRKGDGKGPGSAREAGGGGHGPFSRSGVNDYLVSDGFLLSLSMCKRGFHDLLKVRLSSLLMLCGFISSSVASLMNQSIYPVFAERSSVSCSFTSWNWLMLWSATADFSVCASLMCLPCSFILMWMDQLLCTMYILPHSHGMP